ncbi:hypothetical protein GDO78_007427 [Eleutherodactylus coqui]|uniref:RIMS-binding protein 2 n=1 Tax=Eleutherodactylus coqui TaxID=57060 RepID=A0A8J6KDE8_ELECQ|nr:hypothetical protein GDO78_007427 [Eleutherodactylus coqui]
MTAALDPSGCGGQKKSSTALAKKPPTRDIMRSVNGGPAHSPCPSKESEREVEIRLLQVECDELRTRLGCLKEGLMGQKPSDVEHLLKQSQKELLWLQRQLSYISNGGPPCILSPNKLRNDLQCLPPSVQHRTYNQIHFLEEKTRSFKSDVTSVSPERVQWSFLENELKDAVQDKSRLNFQYASLSHRALQYDQVKLDYEQLRETLAIVTKERDLAVKEKYQLQAKLENLEQVLKHMREAAERRQQLELEHEQALAVLNAKQQEIELLQKAQVEAKKEHEGAVQLLENTLDSMQAKVRELEEKCRTQSEQFNLLSRELEKFRQQAGNIDLLSGNAIYNSDIPGSPNKAFAQLMNGIATTIGKGHESPTGSRSLISEFIRPLQITGDKPEQLSVKPTFLLRPRSGSPRRRFESDVSPPIAPENVTVHPGPTAVTLLVTWRPPVLSPTGTSNGANVTGFAVYSRGQKVAEVVFPAAENIVVDLMKILNLDAKEVTVRTLSAQGESEDSCSAVIPPDLLTTPAHQHPRTMPKCKPLASAGVPDTKDEHVCPHRKMDDAWDHSHTVSHIHGHTLEPPTSNFHSPGHGRRSPSPQRILPQPQGAPISNTMAKAMAREAAQRVAESTRNEKRNLFSERSNAIHDNSDEEEDGYDSPHIKRKGASVDEFLKGSELGKQPHYCPGDDYHTESSRGSDLSDILEEDEEDLYSEMQLEDGGRRRVSVTSHNTLKCSKTSATEPSLKEQLEFSPQHPHYKKLFSIPEVAEEESGEHSEVLHSGNSVGMASRARGTIVRTNRVARASCPDGRHQSPWHYSKCRFNGALPYSDDFTCEGSKLGTLSRSPDSGLDCGSEEEEARFHYRKGCNTIARNTSKEPQENSICPRDPKQMLTRRKTLTRQSSVEEDFGDFSSGFVDNTNGSEWHHENFNPLPCVRDLHKSENSCWKPDVYQKNCSTTDLRPTHRDTENSPLLGNHSTLGRTERPDHPMRRFTHGSNVQQRPRPMMVPSIEITMDSNSEGGRSRSGSEGNISPVKEESYYRSIGGHRKWSLQRTRASEDRYDSYGSREKMSSEMYDESETDGGMEDYPVRIFVALFDYDPRTMSPNPDAAEEELPFKEGQIIKVYGDKDPDGFYRGESCGRSGYIPCNMVSEIQADDEEMMDQLLKQGFLPLNTPVEKIVNCERFKESSRSVHRRSRKSKRERNRRSGRQHSVSTRRMVALYDYDPRESSPNVDVEAELTFCTGDIITVFGEIDEDGFYYGELNGHKGLVPSNFLEEVPDDVEVYLSDAPSRYPADTPMRTKVKRAPSENTGTPRRAPSPTVHLHSLSPPTSMGSGSPMRSRDRTSKKKKGLLSKGKKLLKKLGAVK